jgi:hypothetical protein
MGQDGLFMLPPPFTDHLTRDLDRSTFQICVQSSLCAFCAVRSLCGAWLPWCPLAAGFVRWRGFRKGERH